MSRLLKDLSSFPSTASTSQDDHESNLGSTSSRKLNVTLLNSEWRSTKGGLSTLNRELAIQLAKHPSVEVSVYLPQCSEEDKRVAASHNVQLIEAEERPGFDPVDWLSFLPKDHAVDCVIGHGAILGRQVQGIKRDCSRCKWIQVVHTAPEELGMYKKYDERISKSEKKHQVEVELCKLADQVVAVGPKLADAFLGYLRSCKKHEDVVNLTPGIFSEFSYVKQASQEISSFSVLVFGRSDSEDFQLKGYDIAAQAIAELKDMTYKLVFVGATSGEEEKVADLLLKQGINRSQLRVRRFNESREHLARLFCEVDLAIMPSRTEGFGLAALEALSAGLPVLVSGNSGLGEALKKVPFASSCVVQSEDPKDWANAIKAVREKDRKLRLLEIEIIREQYAKMYTWQDHCNRLVERMLAISQAPNEDEQHLSKEDSVIGQDEKPSSSEKRLHKGTAKRPRSSKKGKRPLSSRNTPALKHPRLVGDEAVWDNSVVKLLKAEYKRRSQLRPLLWDNTIELPLENVYTRLKIVSRRKLAIQVKDDKVNAFNSFKASLKGEDVMMLADFLDKNRANVFHSFTVPNKIEDVVSPTEGGNADVLREPDEVNVFEIFKTLEKGEDAMTLVEGSPGIGKTTFCLKLAHDWAHGKIPSECSFPKFEFVLLLKCRDIDRNIMDTIREQLLPRDIDEETVEKLLHFMKDIHNQEKILIILDGLDELPEKSQCHVDELLHRRILPFCYVLATSRQERGIDVRKRFVFDIYLQIKGFTESDAFEYIRKHFANIGRGHSPKGERLITEIKDNKFLHALRSNPLNLLLLCVIYEDYEGKLPSSRSRLYQVIVLCLLRRYCAKHNLQAPEGDDDLERCFEKDILALGELAWMCLLSDRHGFREKELAELEIRYKGLVSRHIGLLYKEESLKRLTPQHEYYFLHKTFQEYLAAAYVAHKLRRNQLNLFERLSFDDLVDKYRQVFLFVSGILGMEASILFAQIGVELKNREGWNWNYCRVLNKTLDFDILVDPFNRGLATATFLTESFNESGHAEKMAVTLCSYIPFPQQVDADLSGQKTCNIFHVLEACKSFCNLQKPVNLTIRAEKHDIFHYHRIAEYIQSCPKTQKLNLFTPTITLDLANALHDGLFENTSLSEFTLQMSDSIPCNAAVLIGELLAARRSLRKVKFQLDRVWGETWVSAIEPALFADTPLKSVDLHVRGSLSDTAVHGLGKLLSNEALASFSFNISGDLLEFVAAVISRGIAQQTTLKALAFSVDGNLSLSSVNALQNSILENSSLSDLVMSLRGEIPDNWQSVVEKLRSVKKGSLNCTFDPDPGSSVTCNQVALFRPAVVEKELETKQHFTVVLWGELKCSGAEDLCKILVRVPLTSLTLRVHGKLSDGVANIIKRYIGQQNTLSTLTVNTWRKLTLGTGTLLQELSDKNVTVQVKEHDVSVVPKEACNALDVSTDNPASLTPVFSEVKNTRKERITLKIINDDKVISDWPRLLGDALAESTSLTTLDLTVSNYTMNTGIWKYLGDSLLRSSSLTVLSLTISNYSNLAKGWEYTLVNSLAKMTSLTTLSLSIDDRGEARRFEEDLMAVKSLSTLSVVINGSKLTDFWGKFLRKCLDECNSLTKLCITSNDYTEHEDSLLIRFHDSIEKPVSWQEGLAFGLAYTSSLKELVITINHITRTYFDLEAIFIGRLSVNNSIASLTVTVSDYQLSSCALWVGSLKSFIAENKSLITLTLTLNDYSDGEQHNWLYPGRRDGDFPENTSLTELNLTVNIRHEVRGDWLPSFCGYLMMNCSSLRTVRLHVNNRCATSNSRIYDLSKLRLKYRSLSTFELSVTFYGE